MKSTKQTILLCLFIVLFTIVHFAETAQAKSVYVITNHMGSTVKAYDIQDDQIEEQKTAENLSNHASGAVGLALDPDSETLFVTYEESNIIEMLNAKTMISEENPVTVLGVGFYGLSGIAFDQSKQCLSGISVGLMV